MKTAFFVISLLLLFTSLFMAIYFLIWGFGYLNIFVRLPKIVIYLIDAVFVGAAVFLFVLAARQLFYHIELSAYKKIATFVAALVLLAVTAVAPHVMTYSLIRGVGGASYFEGRCNNSAFRRANDCCPHLTRALRRHLLVWFKTALTAIVCAKRGIIYSVQAV